MAKGRRMYYGGKKAQKLSSARVAPQVYIVAMLTVIAIVIAAMRR